MAGNKYWRRIDSCPTRMRHRTEAAESPFMFRKAASHAATSKELGKGEQGNQAGDGVVGSKV